MTTPYDTIKSAVLGNPVDPNKKPSRTGVVQAFAEMQLYLEAAQSGAIVKDTLANLTALTAAPYLDVMAWVVADPTPANNGIYEMTGTLVAPTWARWSDVPQFFVTGINIGGGTPNAIQVTTDLAFPTADGRCLLGFPVLDDNTVSPPTLQINGGAVLPIVTVSGADVPAHGIKTGMMVSGFVSGGKFRLISDIATQAFVDAAAAEAADAAASAAAALDAYNDTVAALASVEAELDTKYDKSGGTLTGNVTVDTGGTSQISIDKTEGQSSRLRFTKDGLLRWETVGNNDAEIGANEGTDYKIFAYNDAGSLIGAALEIKRATRVANFPVRPTWNGTGLATVDEAAAGGGGAGVSSFNGRTGVVTPANNDYSGAQVSHGASNVSAALDLYAVKTPWLTPEMFGAVGNNSTDDLAAFVAMFAAVGSRGAKLFLPAKPYYFSNDLIIQDKTVNVEGVNGNTTSLGTMLRFAANKGIIIANNEGSSFRDFRLQGDAASTTGQLLGIGQFGAADGSTYCSFENLNISGHYRNLWLQNSLETRFNRCRFTSAFGFSAINIADGAEATHGVDAAEFVQCVLSAAQNGTTHVVHANGRAASIKFTQCPILYGNIGFYLRNTIGGTDPKFWYFSDGGFENCEGECVRVEVGDDIKFTNSYMSNDGDADLVYMGASMLGRLKISNSILRGGGRDGIRYLGGRLMAVGNDIINCGRAVTGDGIYLASGVTRFVIADNYIGNGPDGTMNQRYGIRNDAGASAGKISDNYLIGNITGDFGGTTGGTGAGITNNL